MIYDENVNINHNTTKATSGKQKASSKGKTIEETYETNYIGKLQNHCSDYIFSCLI